MPPADCVSIVKLAGHVQVPLGERAAVMAAFARAWPTIRWEAEGEVQATGVLTSGGLTCDVTLSYREGFYGASVDSEPERSYFDEAFLAQVDGLCEAQGWTAIYFDSAEDRYL